MSIPRGSTIFIASQGHDNMTVAEIGVRSGENAKSLLRYLDIRRLYLVDHYPEYIEGPRHFTQAAQLAYWTDMFEAMKPFQQKVTLIHQPSKVAAGLFDDQVFDMVYIDADHRQESVWQDINLWWPKVKRDRYLCGHDYHNDWPGVKQAVVKFATDHRLELKLLGTSDWLIRKQ